MKCDQDIAYLMYNDQPPVGAKSLNHGHTKGQLTIKNVTFYSLQVYHCCLIVYLC